MPRDVEDVKMALKCAPILAASVAQTRTLMISTVSCIANRHCRCRTSVKLAPSIEVLHSDLVKKPVCAMASKRQLSESLDLEQGHLSKRPRHIFKQQPRPQRTRPDLLSPLSDELLIRVLSYLPIQDLVFSVAPVSRRFHRLADDSQLWKALYYTRFVLPRAMRIPGFRANQQTAQGLQDGRDGHKLHYSGRRRLWADGRSGGVIRDPERNRSRLGLEEYGEDEEDPQEKTAFDPVDWKRQYKIRHNWSRGKCAVEELRVAEGGVESGRKVLVKVVEGVAITADAVSGLRAWDLKTRETFAQTSLGEVDDGGQHTDDLGQWPTCMAVDGADGGDSSFNLGVGFLDGSFGVWKLDVRKKRFELRYRHQKSSNGELLGMALSYPYLLTATRSVLISLYTFDIPKEALPINEEVTAVGSQVPRKAAGLPSPYLLTSLKSHSSRAPIALSIRATSTTTIASIAYTFSTLTGWSIGMQDLQITESRNGTQRQAPEVSMSRLAYTPSVAAGRVASSPLRPTTPSARLSDARASPNSSPETPSTPRSPLLPEPGPTTLCYTHPYLLAALPDNTLVLHLVTSTAKALTLSPGIRLWGHTSGISDAEITSRGKAVSVSERGNEMRVWELEGGPGPRTGAGSGKSIEIRPEVEDMDSAQQGYDWDERRNWVGFDDEMVIVLKEGASGESLMVYDFT